MVKHLPYVAKALCSSLEREAGLEIMKGYAYVLCPTRSLVFILTLYSSISILRAMTGVFSLPKDYGNSLEGPREFTTASAKAHSS